MMKLKIVSVVSVFFGGVIQLDALRLMRPPPAGFHAKWGLQNDFSPTRFGGGNHTRESFTDQKRHQQHTSHTTNYDRHIDHNHTEILNERRHHHQHNYRRKKTTDSWGGRSQQKGGRSQQKMGRGRQSQKSSWWLR